MYTLEDLFDRRSPVGTRLEQILMEKKCTKAELSKKTGVSRPTIDKVLSGNHICLFDYLFISSQMSAKPYFIGSTGILLLW